MTCVHRCLSWHKKGVHRKLVHHCGVALHLLTLDMFCSNRPCIIDNTHRSHSHISEPQEHLILHLL